MSAASSRFQRRIFLINKPFQLRFSFYVVSWIAALSLVYPLLIRELYNWFFRYLSVDPHGPMIPAIAQARKEMMLWLAFLQVTFVVMTFLLSILLSHRIAGPLYKLAQAMNEVAHGKLPRITFRKADHFKELAAGFNRMAESIHDTTTAAETHIRKAMDRTTDEGARKELESALQTLKNLQ